MIQQQELEKRWKRDVRILNTVPKIINDNLTGLNYIFWVFGMIFTNLYRIYLGSEDHLDIMGRIGLNAKLVNSMTINLGFLAKYEYFGALKHTLWFWIGLINVICNFIQNSSAHCESKCAYSLMQIRTSYIFITFHNFVSNKFLEIFKM